ncbi:MAG TPA: PilZ domain-containing protein [Methylomirabilota bacterium]|nr:PilZ domain-containing protein [Methylomirabilota bacterium]
MHDPHLVTGPRPAEHRRHARVVTSWPVTVQTGDRLLRLQTLNLSALGAKVSLQHPLPSGRLEVGRSALLRLEPPDRPPVEVEAIVWRTDDDGPAFFFLGTTSVA